MLQSVVVVYTIVFVSLPIDRFGIGIRRILKSNNINNKNVFKFIWFKTFKINEQIV